MQCSKKYWTLNSTLDIVKMLISWLVQGLPWNNNFKETFFFSNLKKEQGNFNIRIKKWRLKLKCIAFLSKMYGNFLRQIFLFLICVSFIVKVLSRRDSQIVCNHWRERKSLQKSNVFYSNFVDFLWNTLFNNSEKFINWAEVFSCLLLTETLFASVLYFKTLEILPLPL